MHKVICTKQSTKDFIRIWLLVTEYAQRDLCAGCLSGGGSGFLPLVKAKGRLFAGRTGGQAGPVEDDRSSLTGNSENKDWKATVEFLMAKARLLEHLRGVLTPRQETCLLRMFRKGPDGFVGGLRAGNCLRITRATRPAATRDLADLVAKGTRTKTGERKFPRDWLRVGVKIGSGCGYRLPVC